MENNLTFEEAKQLIAEKLGFKTIKIEYKIDSLYTEAAELWQQSNLERIKELENELKGSYNLSEHLRDKLETFKALFKSPLTNLELLEKNWLKAKELLNTK